MRRNPPPLEEIEFHSVWIAKLEMLHATWRSFDLRNGEAGRDDSSTIAFDRAALEGEMVG